MSHPYEEDLAGKGHNSDSTGDEILQFVERAEQIASEKQDLSEQEKEIFKEAKSRGYDTKTIRRLIKERKKTQDQRDEEDMLFTTYAKAIGLI